MHSKRKYMQNSGVTSPISSLVPISFSLNHHKSSISVTLHMPMLCTLSKISKTISSGTGCQIMGMHYLNSYTMLTPLSCPLLFQSKMGLASQMLRSQPTKCLPSHQGVVRKESRRDLATNVAAPVVHLAVIVSFISKYLFPLIN